MRLILLHDGSLFFRTFPPDITAFLDPAFRSTLANIFGWHIVSLPRRHFENCGESIVQTDWFQGS